MGIAYFRLEFVVFSYGSVFAEKDNIFSPLLLFRDYLVHA